MNGMKYTLFRQKRSVEELAKLTGVPETQIREMLEERVYEKPSHFYMRTAAALGVPVEALVRDCSDNKEESGVKDGQGTMWEDWFERRPDTICRIYLAQITGPHSEYRFNRAFRHLTYQYSRCNIHCFVDRLEDGVYEVNARWYDAGSGEPVHARRKWFAAVDGVFYDLKEQDVLYTSLNLEERKKRSGAA